MGIFWSTRHDHYIHEYENPHVQQLQRDVMLHLTANDDGALVCNDGVENPFSNFVSDEDVRQRAVVLNVRLKSVKNEFTEPIQLCLNGIFEGSTVYIPCPPSSAIVVQPNDQLLYQNEHISPKDVSVYAGLNDIMLIAQDCEEAHEVFANDHPMVTFIKTIMSPEPTDFIERTNNDGNRVFYLITKTYLKKVRTILKEQVFDHIHYTRFKNCKLSCDNQVEGNHSLFIMLSVEYVLVNTGIASLRQKIERLK